jgi:hypothetical protein
MRPDVPQNTRPVESSERTNSEPGRAPQDPSANRQNKIPVLRARRASPEGRGRGRVKKFDRLRAVLAKIDELLTAEGKAEGERDAR